MNAIIAGTLSLVATVAVTLGSWYLMTTPPGSIAMPEPVHRVLVRSLTYPVYYAGQVTGHSMMCCFCTEDQMFRQWIRVAAPTYGLIISLPMIIASLAAGSRD